MIRDKLVGKSYWEMLVLKVIFFEVFFFLDIKIYSLENGLVDFVI